MLDVLILWTDGDFTDRIDQGEIQSMTAEVYCQVSVKFVRG